MDRSKAGKLFLTIIVLIGLGCAVYGEDAWWKAKYAHAPTYTVFGLELPMD